MGLRPSSQNCNNTVQKYIGTGYDTVKKVADNIEEIREVSDNLSLLKEGGFTFLQEEVPVEGSLLAGMLWRKESTNQVFCYYIDSEVNTEGVWVETYYN